MKLFSDIAIQQFLSAIGEDLGPCGIDGDLGEIGADTYSRRAIDNWNEKNGMARDGGAWGEGCQRAAERALTAGVQLTPNFSSSELGCGIAVSDDPDAPHDPECYHWPDMINLTAVRLLQVVRNTIGSPIQVTSGVRCETYNNSLSGSSTESAHMKGRAFDFNAMGVVSYEELKEIAYNAGFTYAYVGNGYVHAQYDGEDW